MHHIRVTGAVLHDGRVAEALQRVLPGRLGMHPPLDVLSGPFFDVKSHLIGEIRRQAMAAPQ